jgi:hypothetical protein
MWKADCGGRSSWLQVFGGYRREDGGDNGRDPLALALAKSEVDFAEKAASDANAALRASENRVSLKQGNDAFKPADVQDRRIQLMRMVTQAENALNAARQKYANAGSRPKDGNSLGLTPQPQRGPRVGDTKTFPNGKTAKWDGQGWALIPSSKA